MDEQSNSTSKKDGKHSHNKLEGNTSLTLLWRILSWPLALLPNSCVTGGVQFVSAKLRDEENLHPDGPCLQQFRLHNLLPDRFDHFFQMEPDVAPVQVRLLRGNEGGREAIWWNGWQ